MPLLNQREIKADTWRFLEDNEPLPALGDIVVTLDRLVSEFKTLMLHPDSLGVSIPNDRPVAELEPYLQRLQLVVLEFPVFTDGRAYSQARALRSHLEFSGELRATGNLLPDQLGFMQQVGIDWFDIADERFDLTHWLKASDAISLTYQRRFTSRNQVNIVDARDAEDGPEQRRGAP